jgi:hypothetical protein
MPHVRDRDAGMRHAVRRFVPSTGIAAGCDIVPHNSFTRRAYSRRHVMHGIAACPFLLSNRIATFRHAARCVG